MIDALPELLEVSSNLQLEIPGLLCEVPLLGLELILLLMQVLALLIGNVKQAFEVLEKDWMCSLDGLDLVTLVLSMDDALGADRWALAREAEVADEFVWMRRARGASTSHL